MDEAPRRRSYSLQRHRLDGFDYRDVDHAYFVTVRARSGMPFAEERLARTVLGSLEWVRGRRNLALYAYCLMPDHLHLLLQLTDGSLLGTVIGSFKSLSTRESWALGCHGALWQPRFYDHVVRRREDGEQIAGYILANPVRKGLVAQPDAYPWSGTPDPL